MFLLKQVLSVIQALGESLKVRQQVIATATVYFKRFYSRYPTITNYLKLKIITGIQ